ncbi:hypothetical protein RhiJN_02513 [Ceratobasidium sp. AG-Ba]|nr:hypothetical protein RhiJN_02513 [Ceratobasidium sp. AG-Ba]
MNSLRDFQFRLPRVWERKDVAGSSLAASSLLSGRLLAWAGSNDRERCLDMRFHGQWGNENCRVMQWYKSQKVSSTTFRSIEHRHCIQGPFYHEYLFLKLSDGAVCRVERLGEGSRTDAIRYFGCKSYDLIQWFPKDKYSLAATDSNLIAEIDLGRNFDMLHVLAICHAMHNIKSCSVYTLQRWNCYFLCLTILAVLTRRVANWETGLAGHIWDSCLESVVDKLSSLSPEAAANEHVMLRLCAALDPDNPRAADPVFQVLRQCLTMNSDCLAAYNIAISRTLWMTSWDHPLSQSLDSVIVPATDLLLKGQSRCARGLQEIDTMAGNRAVGMILENERLANLYVAACGKYFSWLLEHTTSGYESLRRLRQFERPVSLPLRVLCFPIGILRALLFPSGVISILEVGDRDESLWEYLRRATDSIPFTTLSAFCASFMLHNLAKLDEEEGDFHAVSYMGEKEKHIPSTYISAVMDAVDADMQSDHVDLQVLLGQVITKYDFIELQSMLIAPGLASSLSNALEKRQPRLTIHVLSEDVGKDHKRVANIQMVTKFQTVGEFQRYYIKQRIDDHARRVERHQLASASLVSQDIQRTMQDIWKACRFKVF